MNAVRAEIHRFAATPVTLASAVAACTPMAGHLRRAGEAAVEIFDRVERLDLVDAVEAMAVDLDRLAQLLSMSPSFEWQTSFAATFDAENDLRRRVGLPAKARPYFGRMSPHEAIVEARKLADKLDAPEVTAPRSPASAVRRIVRSFDQMHARRILGVNDFETNMRQRWPEMKTPLYINALVFAAELALSAAGASLGAVVSLKMKDRLEKRVLSKALHLSEGAQKLELAKGLVSRTMVAEAAKDVTRQLFGRVSKAGLAELGSGAQKNLSDDVATSYAQLQRRTLQTDHEARGNALEQLVDVLQLADVGELVQLDADLEQLVLAATPIQYEHTMVEWMNLQARADRRAQSDGSADARIDDQSWRGVLDVKMFIATDGDRHPQVEVSSPDMAYAEYKFLRDSGRTVGSVGLHQHYQLRLRAFGNERQVHFGVAPSGALQLGSLSQREKIHLRLLASGHVFSGTEVWAAESGQMPDLVSVDAALTFLADLIAVAQATPLGRIEK